MLYACTLLYVILIYVRPAEIVASWATIPFVDILSIVAAAFAAFSIAVKPRKFFELPQDKLLLIFWAIVGLSNLLYWIFTAIDSWLAFLPSVFCYFLVRASIQREGQLRGLLYLLILLNVFLAVNGIVQYHTGVGLGDVQMQLNRIYGLGIFNDPNDLGMTFVMAVPFIVAVIGNRSSGVFNRLWCVAALGVILLAVYYTNSRGALLGLGAAMISYFFLRFRKASAGVVGALLLLVMVIAAPSRGGEIGYSDESAQSRIQSWAEGWGMLKTHPIMGVGHERFTEFNGLVAHNSFVQTFSELGLPGAFCFIGLFYWYFKGLWPRSRATSVTARWNAALIASGAGVAMCCWFLSRQYVVILYVLLALGASAAALSKAENEKQGEKEVVRVTFRDMLKIGGLTVGAIVVVYVSIRTMAVWSGG